MGRNNVRGLVRRGSIWHVDKRICRRRVCQSTGAAQLAEAERYLARLMEAERQAVVYGVRPSRSFEEAAAKYVLENTHKRTLSDDISLLKGLMPWIGAVPIDKLHMGTLQPWIAAGTINNGLPIVRRILDVAASEWMDDQGLTWLQAPPKIKLIANPIRRQPYPLSWDEQSRLFRELPSDLAEMALFAVNTGCRSSEICALRWEWEVKVPELGTSVFIVPGARVKNGDERLVVLNRVAMSVVEAQRGKHATHVFTYNGKPRASFLNSSWEGARERDRPAAGAGARLEAHLRPSSARGRGELRGSAGPPGPPLREDHDTLFGGGALAPH